jgi:hypothetical protein
MRFTVIQIALDEIRRIARPGIEAMARRRK